MLRRVLGVVLVLSFLVSVVSAAADERLSASERVAYLAKPAVVRIFDGYVATARYEGLFSKTDVPFEMIGAGSGAFIDPNGFIATNAHVVEIGREGKDDVIKELYAKYAATVAKIRESNPFYSSYLLVDDTESQFNKSLRIEPIHKVVLQTGETFDFEIKAYGTPVVGKDVAIIKINAKNMPSLQLADSDKVRMQQHITVLGYPAAADSDRFDKLSALEPSITDGRVSAEKRLESGTEVFQIDASTTHGNSGGPVVNDDGEIVGLLTFRGDTVQGQEVQGFNFLMPSNVVKEFVGQTEAKNTASSNDVAYRQGLNLYFDGKYRSALAKFEKLRGNKQYPAVASLLNECAAKKDLEPNGLSTALFYAFGAFLLIVASIGAGAVMTSLRISRKSSQQQSTTVQTAVPETVPLDQEALPGPFPTQPLAC